jgi:hypothetical protein
MDNIGKTSFHLWNDNQQRFRHCTSHTNDGRHRLLHLHLGEGVRMKSVMPVGMAAMFAGMLALAVIYAMLGRTGSGAAEGARSGALFGALIGVFAVCGLRFALSWCTTMST